MFKVLCEKIKEKWDLLYLIGGIILFAIAFIVTTRYIFLQDAITLDGVGDLYDKITYNDGNTTKVIVFDSDCTDSIMWSLATLRSNGRLLSTDFYYPCLLAFGGNLFFFPFLAIFGFGAMAQKCGMFLFLLAVTAALYFFFKAFSLKLADRFYALGIVLSISITGSMIRQIMWMHILYYNLGLLLFILAATFSTLYMKQGKKKYLVFHAIILALSVLNSFTEIAIVALPFIGASLTEMLFFDNKKETVVKHKALIVSQLAGLFFGAIIRVITAHGIETSGYDKFYAKYGNSDAISENFGTFFTHWFTLLGVSNTYDTDFLSITGIKYALFIVVAVLILIIPFTLWLRKKELKDTESALLIQYTVLTAFMLFGYVFGRFADHNRRLTENVMVAAIITMLFIFTNKKNYANKKLLITLFFIGFSVCYLGLFSLTSKKDPDIAHKKLAEYLIDNDLTLGISDYWDTNVTAFYGNGKLIVVPVDFNNETDTINAYRYNTFKSWVNEVENSGAQFLVIRDNFYNNLSPGLKHLLGELGDEEIVTDYRFHVIKFKEPYQIN